MFQSFFKKNNQKSTANVFKAMLMGNSGAEWTASSYEQFCMEGYIKNVIAHRCVAMIARSASFINFKCGIYNDIGMFMEDIDHEVSNIFEKPNMQESFYDIMERVYSYKLLWGNAFLLVQKNEERLESLKCLRPDRVTILSDDFGGVVGYRYKYKNYERDFPVYGDGSCDVIHIKSFHPLNDFYGLSAMEAAKYSIDQHNEAAKYTKALLQNSARPSGALIVRANEYNNGGKLTDEQFDNLKSQMFSSYSGIGNVGKPLILEGGLDWKEMSISPKDMDFIETKHAAAREIALAFGVPPQLLGIPGDNTYSNFSEARIFFWEQTIIPLIQDVAKTLERGFRNILNENSLVITFRKDEIAQISQKEMNLND